MSKVPGLNIFTVAYDTLHCLEEGVSARTLANCLFDLIIKPGGLGAGSQDQNLQRMYKLIRQQYLGLESSQLPKWQAHHTWWLRRSSGGLDLAGTALSPCKEGFVCSQ